ncbi:unnamed protein product [Mycena citricolor]|uniref:Uncharacterized protein n=1 Tax=Mycena citricolor TaxID=2018698 RepID=A0AAD2JYL1_9AGAR|nr:unnamed protein product [Mycena citricolor]
MFANAESSSPIVAPNASQTRRNPEERATSSPPSARYSGSDLSQRKRDSEETGTDPTAHAPPTLPPVESNVNRQAPPSNSDRPGLGPASRPSTPPRDLIDRFRGPVSPGLPLPPPSLCAEDEIDITSVEGLPPRLRAAYVEGANTVLGCSPAKAMYLVMKAKHRFAMQERDLLEQELQRAEAELMRERECKDQALDSLLRRWLGSEADHLIAEIPVPPSMFVERVGAASNSMTNTRSSQSSYEICNP